MAKLDLTPKAKSSIKNLTLWVDQSIWLPVRSTVVESNGTPTSFIFTDLRLNQAIPDSTFKVELPKGIKIVRR